MTAFPIPFEQLPDEAILRLPMVLALTGRSRSGFWAGVKAGTLPKPVKIGGRAVGWRVGAIRQLLAGYAVAEGIDGNAAKAVATSKAKREAAKAELV